MTDLPGTGVIGSHAKVGEQAGSILRLPLVSTVQAEILKTEESYFSVQVMSWPTSEVCPRFALELSVVGWGHMGDTYPQSSAQPAIWHCLSSSVPGRRVD